MVKDISLDEMFQRMLFQDYKAFMSRLLENGYAKRSDETPIGKTWYIPHHGVYHPSKPGKICVVFDCKAGGFNLTKFVSNNKELLLSIPESKRRQGVKDQDLSGDLPTDKALGICWDIANDTFKFKIKVDGRKLTKRTMFVSGKLPI